MLTIYMDEKGPQETYRISQPFSWEEKLAHGTDSMTGYIANVFGIFDTDSNGFEKDFLLLESNYLSGTQNPDAEIKGSKLLRKCDLGVISLTEKMQGFTLNSLNF